MIDLHDESTWFPAGSPAYKVWLCGRCNAELTDDDPRTCEVCGSRYHTGTGEYLGDGDVDS